MNRLSNRSFARPALYAALFAVLAFLGVWTRTGQHPLHFAPVAASALFIAYVTGRSWTGLLLAPLTMLIGDRIMGFYDWRVMVCVYAAVAFPAVLRVALTRKVTLGRLAGCSVLSSVVFFLVTNFAVWAFGAPESTYPYTALGLAECYLAGLPFIKNTLLGDLAWTGAFFGLYSIGQALVRKGAVEATAGRLIEAK
jgi:hypothetical protein